MCPFKFHIYAIIMYITKFVFLFMIEWEDCNHSLTHLDQLGAFSKKLNSPIGIILIV